MVSVKVTIKVSSVLCYYVKVSSVNLSFFIYPLYKNVLKSFTIKLSELLAVDMYMPNNPIPTV